MSEQIEKSEQLVLIQSQLESLLKGLTVKQAEVILFDVLSKIKVTSVVEF